MVLGCIIDLSRVLDSRHYDNTIPDLELAEQDAARNVYWDFVDRFSRAYVLVRFGQRVDPKTAFFQPHLVNIASALIACKRIVPNLDRTFSLAVFTHEIMAHFSKHHANLKPYLERRVKDKANTTFSYKGPPFTIDMRRAGETVQHHFRDEPAPISELPNLYSSFSHLIPPKKPPFSVLIHHPGNEPNLHPRHLVVSRIDRLRKRRVRQRLSLREDDCRFVIQNGPVLVSRASQLKVLVLMFVCP
jgi:hypothetical protein